MMKYLLLLVVAVAAHGQYGAATSVVSGNGAPIAAQCTNANNVGRVWARKDGADAGTTFYVCGATGVGTYGWELRGGAPGGGAALSTTGSVPFVTSGGVLGQDAGQLSWSSVGDRLTIGNASAADGAGILTQSVGTVRWTATPGGGGAFVINNSANTGIFFQNNAITHAILNSTGNLLLGTTTEGNFRLDVASSGSSGTLRAYDQTPTTGVTQLIVRAGAGQSTTNLTTWQNAAGSGRLLVTSSLGLVALGTFYSVQDSAGTINRAIIQSTMDVNSSYSFNFSNTTDAAGTKDLSLSRAGVNIGQFGDGGSNSNGLLYLKGVRPVGSTVANLPAAAGNTGMMATVTDATVTTIGTTVAGGGANTVLVWSNGTNWRIYAN